MPLILKGTLPNAGDIVKFDLEPSPTKPGQSPAEIWDGPDFSTPNALNCLCLWKLAASLRCVQRTFHGRFCITSHIISLLVLSQGTRPRIAQAAQRQWASLAWDPWMAAYCRRITAAKALLFFGKSWLIYIFYIFNLINSLITNVDFFATSLLEPRWNGKRLRRHGHGDGRRALGQSERDLLRISRESWWVSTGECHTNAACTERNGRHGRYGRHGYDERCLDGKVWRTIPVVMKF